VHDQRLSRGSLDARVFGNRKLCRARASKAHTADDDAGLVDLGARLEIIDDPERALGSFLISSSVGSRAQSSLRQRSPLPPNLGGVGHRPRQSELPVGRAT